MIGHPQGASGAAGVVATALALSRGFLPPTINLHDPDPQCDLDFLPTRAGPRVRPRRCAIALDSGRRTPRWCSVPCDVGGRRGAGPAGRLPRRSWRAPGRACGCSIGRGFRAPKLCGDTLNPGALRVLVGTHSTGRRAVRARSRARRHGAERPDDVDVRGDYPAGAALAARCRVATLDALMLDRQPSACRRRSSRTSAARDCRCRCVDAGRGGVVVRHARRAAGVEHARGWSSPRTGASRASRVHAGLARHSPRPATMGDRRLLRRRRRAHCAAARCTCGRAITSALRRCPAVSPTPASSCRRTHQRRRS